MSEDDTKPSMRTLAALHSGHYDGRRLEDRERLAAMESALEIFLEAKRTMNEREAYFTSAHELIKLLAIIALRHQGAASVRGWV